jgi:hypothetical protein
MGRDLRLLAVWSLALAVVAGGSAWAYYSASAKCERMGGQWIESRSLCLCDGELIAL